jgi:hypothetical protein
MRCAQSTMPLDTTMFSPLYQVLVCIILIILLATFASARKHHANPSGEPTRVRLTTLRDVRELLAPTATPLATLLAQRAAPNVRLVRAFGITNTFVSPDVDTHATFTRAARALIRHVDGDDSWDAFAQHARDAVERCLRGHAEAEPDKSSIPFDALMQNVVLHVILSALFAVPPGEIAVRDLSVVARGINDLWRLSKASDAPPPGILADINTRLHRWIPAESFPNPIDFVVPAFETMWRVVATTIAFAHKDARSLAALRDFLAEPTRRQFGRFDELEERPSVEALVTETIRLYPPTRRISRQVVQAPVSGATWFNKPAPRVLVADVGAVHTDVAIWGSDAAVYDPSRHHPNIRTTEQTQALMGFGLGKLRCVASSWAPQAAGVIVAAVCDRLKDGLGVVEGDGIGGREGWKGWEVKHAYTH